MDSLVSSYLCNSTRANTATSYLPLPMQNAKYQKELEAAVNVVQRACRLCVDVKSSLLSADGQVLEKNDQTPVTVADFGVQALVSLELVVAEKSSSQNELTQDDMLEAIDRGANVAFAFRSTGST